MTPDRCVASAVAAFACLTVALVASGSATATFPGRNGLIAFSSNRHPLLHHPQIFSLSVRGGQLRNLSKSPADDSDSTLSPDGKRIAFSRQGDIWLMNADGSGQRLLASGGRRPVWSPSGRMIAFNGRGPGECPPAAVRCSVAVWTVRVDGSALRRLEPGSRHASWSPSGRRIAYEAAVDLVEGRAHGIRVANADGSHARWLARRAGTAPAWSPDGRLIAYVENFAINVVRPDGSGRRRLAASWFAIWAPRGNRLAYPCGRRDPDADTRALCIIDADGGGRRLVARGVAGPAYGENPAYGADPVAAWSPRGQRLAYVRPDGIFIVNADGRGRTRLARKPKNLTIGSLGWSADGRRLLFTEMIDYNDSEIYTAAADGSGVKPLTRNEFSDFQPAWAPDGRRLAFVRNRDFTFNEIWVMNADGSEQRFVTRDGIEPSWTADGDSIVFTRERAGPLGSVERSIHSVAVSTGRERLLVSVGFGGAPSSDGKKLAFLSNGAVFIAAPDGSGQTRLGAGTGRVRWSPDSTTLAFGCTPATALCTIRVDGTDSSPVVRINDPTVHSYAFSPEGTELAFSSGDVLATSQIEVSGVDGSGRRVITAARGYNANVDWQPLPR